MNNLASSDIRRTRLRSAHRGDLIVPRVNLSKYGQTYDLRRTTYMELITSATHGL